MKGSQTGRIFRDRTDEDMEGLGLKIGDYSFRHPLRDYAKVIMKIVMFSLGFQGLHNLETRDSCL